MSTEKNSAFDLPRRTFNFKDDLAYGESSEDLVKSFLDCLSDGDFEIKSDRYRNGRMIIETQQNPKGAKDPQGNRIWYNSGINTTKAKWWVYVYSPEGAFVVVSVDRIKRYLRRNTKRFNEKTKKNLGDTSNPARGFLLFEHEVMDLLKSKLYDGKENTNTL